MASVILAGTTSTTALNLTGDTSGELQLKTNNGSTTAMTLTTAGNVGIGTSSPAQKLDVAGRGQFTNSSAFNFVLVDSTVSDSYFRLASAGTVKWYLRNNITNSNAFELTPDAGSSTGLYILQGGNVGIGTSSPNYQLQLYKIGAVANYLQVTSGATGTASGNGTLFGVDASGNGIVTVQGAVNYITSVAGAERMRITSAGDVGIGTTSPLAKLDVRSASVTVGSGSGNISVFSTDSQGINLGGTLVLGGNADTQIAFGSIAGRKENSTSNNRSGYLQFSTYQNGVGNVERMRITSGGYVGIGVGATLSPSAILDVRDTSTTEIIVAGFTNNSSANNTTKSSRIALRLADTVGDVKDVVYFTAYPDNANVIAGGLAITTRTGDGMGNERMRITSGGDVLTGSTTTAGTTNPTAINVVGRLRSTQGQTASIANGATVDITLTYPRATVAYLIQSSVNTGNSSAGLFWSNDNGASSTFTLFGQNQNNVAVTSPAAGTIRITNNTGGTCAFNYAFTIIAGL